ncbi:MAG: hypothetical protein F9K29_05430 [Hyphomicrobiaceae bacterium]|nr:MAG: hypothetical protein F9K29_05430 [Hyphomicrobiaceae bacterium]
MRTYRGLDAAKVVETISTLQQRIAERFPGTGLGEVCAELHAIAHENSQRAAAIGRRNIPLRVLVFAALAGCIWLLTRVLMLIDFSKTNADSVYSVLQGIEAALNIVVLMGAALFFLVTVEERLKRRRALRALHELRSIVHVIDMHQLTKDPSTMVSVAGKTPSSPTRTLSPFELTRYLDYCSEMLSLTSKVAVLYAQSFPDPIVTEAVSDIERIGAGLSQKIWQKIMILQTLDPALAAKPAASRT